MALVGASLERFATEVRHLQRSEVGEVREPFRSGQKGSSAMPHKRNPIVSERMAGLARLLRGYAQVGLENVALWHERDISHSSAERVALPDACLALDYALFSFTKVVERLEIDVERMAANLDATRGLVFSQSVLLALVGAGWTRQDAYRLVQRNTMRAWDEGRHLADLLAEDPEMDLSESQLTACFQPESMLEHSAAIFDRLEKLVLSTSYQYLYRGLSTQHHYLRPSYQHRSAPHTAGVAVAVWNESGGDLIGEDVPPPEAWDRVVEHRHVGQPSAEDDHLGVEDIDDGGQGAGQPVDVAVE